MDIVSFFAGCGGLDLGFEQAGFHVVWANESEPAVRDTYVKNHPKTNFVLADICQIKPEEVPDCDGFIGGPPCQSWSVAGKQRGLEDQRGKLFLTYIELIKAKKPKFFVIENVKGLLDEKFCDTFSDFLKNLGDAGYDVKWQLLDAVNYRIPQNRERVFIVGFRTDLKIAYQFPLPTCSEPVTIEQAIGDIVEPPVSYTPDDVLKPNPIRWNHDVLKSPFGDYYHRGNRRRGWRQPSFTIHATAENAPLHPSSPKMLYQGHENWILQAGKEDEYRRLSIRECARIQTFPDSFIFHGSDIKALYKMIGNAVPPRLGNVLAKSILSAIEGIRQTNNGTVKQPSILDACTLVGYYKNQEHKRLVLEHRMYYVRSDGRPGSVFKKDCAIVPKYILLHHKATAAFYELDGEEPILADASYLATLGFRLSGQTYLVFRLKDAQPREIGVPHYNPSEYAPKFTTMKEIIEKE